MASLICPECREEMLPQGLNLNYERSACPVCGKDVFKSKKNKIEIRWTRCDEEDLKDNILIVRH